MLLKQLATSNNQNQSAAEIFCRSFWYYNPGFCYQLSRVRVPFVFFCSPSNQDLWTEMTPNIWRCYAIHGETNLGAKCYINYVILHQILIKKNVTSLNQCFELTYYTLMLPSSLVSIHGWMEVRRGKQISLVCARCLTFLDSALASLYLSSIGLEAQAVCEANSFEDCVQLSGMIFIFFSLAGRKHKKASNIKKKNLLYAKSCAHHTH